MKPTLVLVGRPNVGKSTLFNRLTRSRDALVADIPGLTRDRRYGHGRIGDRPYLVMDTGGLEPVTSDGIMYAMAQQSLQAIDEADQALFIVDARQGITAQDKIIAEQLRKKDRNILLVVNKAEGMVDDVVTAEFFELGLGKPHAISALHGDHVNELVALALADFPALEEEAEQTSKHPKIAIVGRPNVGKSTLVNTLLGEERVIAFDQPGTTRDSIYIDFDHNGTQYTLIDTAGLRKRGKVKETVEKFSAIKTLQAIEDANVVVLVLDARSEIAEQDAHIADFILQSGKALVVAVNKWDGLDQYQRECIKHELARKLGFLNFAKLHFISALKGTGTLRLLVSVNQAYAAAMADLSTPQLTRALHAAVEKHAPPRGGMSRPKLRYAHQGGTNPPIVVIHGSMLEHVPDTYQRYLENFFREAFKLTGTPLRITFKAGHNPYADKKPAPPSEAEIRRARNRRRRNRKKYG
ncbi:ribosome biogenesis GTPase Der [Nitrosomonas marina]|uniref:GTPase Der n=1 Tax=Nitrosomonas marina TaxID=917 RepID=A0A1H8EXN3_9PROT|nr:ribosome biogenesis GTPase Der [Nitrosomonas marina]SEN24150.1 GTP-binding protein [Nitrosomonas marina]